MCWNRRSDSWSAQKWNAIENQETDDIPIDPSLQNESSNPQSKSVNKNHPIIDDDWGFLLVDSRNAFNELNHPMMLWIIRHEWPEGARSAHNCYRRRSHLMVRGMNGDKAQWIFSMAGITQGDPLSMILYGLGLLPLCRSLRSLVPDTIQPWYADEAGVGGSMSTIRRSQIWLLP